MRHLRNVPARTPARVPWSPSSRGSWCALTLAAALTACSAGGTTPASTASTTAFHIAYQADISSFDPDNNFEVAGLGSILSVYQGLVQYKPGTTTVAGNLATSWDVSPDARTYTFHLRPNVTFHDGTTMTSANVLASFTRRSKPTLELSYFLADVAGMSTPDPATFVLHLKAPEIGLLDNLSSPWGPKVVGPDALVAHAGKDFSASWLTEHADGTGPYRLTTFTRGQRYQLTRFDRYWGPKPARATVDVAIVPDIGQQVLEAKSGQLDAVLHGYPFQQLGALPSSLQALSYDDLGLEMAFVNPHHHLTTSAQRRKVAAALAPQGYLKDAFSGYATAATSLYPAAMKMPGSGYVWPTEQETAAASVAAVQIAYPASEAGVQQHLADLMISALSAAGVKATATSVPDTSISDYHKSPQAAPDILLAQNNPDSADPGSQADLFFSAAGGLNVFGYTNAAADAVLTRADAATDATTRRTLYAQAGKLLFDDGGFLPIADVKDVIVLRRTVTGDTRPAVPWNLDLGTVRGS